MNQLLKLITLTWTLLLTGFTGAQQQESSISAVQWKSYENEICVISYPNDWKLDLSGQMGTKFILFSQSESADDLFKENVNLIVQDLEGLNMTLSDYVSLSERQVETLLTNGKLEASEKKHNANGEHHHLVYFGRQGVFSLRFEQFFWVANDKAYVLTYTCEESKHDYFQPICASILSSFQLK